MLSHGTTRCYQAGCDCPPCRKAIARARKKTRANRKARLAADPTLRPHGEVETYRDWGCRCDLCKAAHAEAMRDYRRSKA